MLLPVSAALELAAFLDFLSSVSGHRPQNTGKRSLEKWVLVVIVAAVGLLATLLVNLVASLFLAARGISPDLPAAFNQRFLVLETWGFLVPFVWGFSAKWLPIFLGLRPIRERWLLAGLGLNSIGVFAALLGQIRFAAIGLCGGILISTWALRLAEPAQQPPKTKGVHSSFPTFIRLAYLWAIMAGSRNLGVGDSGFSWDLGRIAPCLNRWVPCHNGLHHWPTNPARILRNAIAVQQQADVDFATAAGNRMSTSREFG